MQTQVFQLTFETKPAALHFVCVLLSWSSRLSLERMYSLTIQDTARRQTQQQGRQPKFQANGERTADDRAVAEQAAPIGEESQIHAQMADLSYTV